MDGVCESGRRSMLTVSIISVILVTSAIFYSSAVSRRGTYGHINSKSIVFVHGDDRKYFRGSLPEWGYGRDSSDHADSSAESSCSEVIEMGARRFTWSNQPRFYREHQNCSAGCSLFVSDYHPIEDLHALEPLITALGIFPWKRDI